MILKNIYKNLKDNKGKSKHNRGVSLIELLVVIVIFMIISGMTIFSYNDFKSSASIQNLADDIALSVRKAQNYAIGVVGSGGGFNFNYGINFSVNPKIINMEGMIDIRDNPNLITYKTVNSSNKSFLTFIDRDNSGSYTDDPVSTCDIVGDSSCLEYLEILSIKSNDVISEIDLQMGETLVSLKKNDQIDLLFKRPNPEPVFCYRKDNAPTCDENSKKISAVEIYISSERDQTISKKIIISNNGQISVDF